MTDAFLPVRFSKEPPIGAGLNQLEKDLRMPAAIGALTFDFLGIEIEVTVADPECERLLLANYSSLERPAKSPVLSYFVGKSSPDKFLIIRGAEQPLLASDDGDFLFQFEKDVTIEIQKLRPELYFVHAAVLEYKSHGLMLIAMSGGGKSTTAWALSHHGFRYLSDELGPIDLKTLSVFPYLHALGLKNLPPSLYPLPKRTVQTSRTLHVPVKALPGGTRNGPTPLSAIFFLFYRPDLPSPQVQPITRAEAAVRLFANALNPLAHPGEGLDAALEITDRCSCFKLVANDLAMTCKVVKETMEDHINSKSDADERSPEF